MLMRSTHGCGISAGPSLALEAFLSPKQKGSAGSPGLKLHHDGKDHDPDHDELDRASEVKFHPESIQT